MFDSNNDCNNKRGLLHSIIQGHITSIDDTLTMDSINNIKYHQMNKIIPSINDIESPPLIKPENIDTPATSTESAASDVSIQPKPNTSEGSKQTQKDIISKKFNKFLDKRDELKKGVYITVAVGGSFTAVVTSGIYALLWNVVPESFLYTGMHGFLVILSTFIRILGLVIVSIVPVDELDFIREISNSRKLRVPIHIISIVVWISVIVGIGLSKITTTPIFSVLFSIGAGYCTFFQIWWLLKDLFGNVSDEDPETVYDGMLNIWKRNVLCFMYMTGCYIIPCFEGEVCTGYDYFVYSIFWPMFIGNIAYLCYRHAEVKKPGGKKTIKGIHEVGLLTIIYY